MCERRWHENSQFEPTARRSPTTSEATDPALILIDGAMNSRSSGPKPELATLLSRHFTVYSYDRRGRGDSGDTLPYAVDREIEDIEALIGDAGGTAYLFGHSSGHALPWRRR